jgi:hemolysin activation/secretion protein
VGPTVQWDRENFITVDHVRTYDREEDINLGPTLSINVGFARSRWFRESGDATFAKAVAGRGAALGPGAFALASVSGEGQREDGVWKNTRSRWEVEYNNHFSRAQTFTAHAAWEQVLRPGDETQLLLGGDTGLRGYPLNEFAGNRLFTAIAEDRLFFFPDVLHLFGLGGVVFGDAGYAWPRKAAVRFRDLRADVGVGLRFHISRASLGHVIRLDVARPVRPIEGERRWLVTFGTSQVF